jgi:hypothetical protein
MRLLMRVQADPAGRQVAIRCKLRDGLMAQHVNTTSSKAVIRLPLQPALGTWLPRYVLGGLMGTASRNCMPCRTS